MSRIYTDICPYCGEPYTVRYRAETDDFVRIAGCKCDHVNDAVFDALTAIRDLKQDYLQHPDSFNKEDLTEFINRLEAKLEQALQQCR